MTTTDQLSQAELGRIFRASSGRVLAALIAQCGDIQQAEDALQTAFLIAGERWTQDSRPQNPEAWLHTVAKRWLIDRSREVQSRQQTVVQREALAALSSDQSEDEARQAIPDERLKLIFTCCHPALNAQTQTALTLRTLCGLTVREIARAYLVSETTMQQRLVRAKKKIRAAGIAYRVPTADELPDRLAPVLETIYLIYNESYTAFEGQTLSRDDLAMEAIRLARILHHLMPEPEVAGLLSLILLHHARSAARSNADHSYISLEQQDRSLWDAAQIIEGRNLLLTALAQGQPEQYQLQAAISAVHSEASSWAATDWNQILLLYSTLYRLQPSPVVKLNALLALAHTGKVEEAVHQMLELEDRLESYQPFHAALADLLVTANQPADAVSHYDAAIALSANAAQREFLNRKRDQASGTIPK